MRTNECLVTNYKRGDVVLVDNTNAKEYACSHVLRGNRPAVVIQNQIGNDHSPNLIVAYLTTQMKRLEMRTHVLVTWYDGLKPSVILTEQLATIDKSTVLGYITHLRDEDIARLDRALLVSLGLDI